jgi:hypothetical protein
MKSGIVFFRTHILDELSEFYTENLEAKLWLDQGGCRIFDFEGFFFGFCNREQQDLEGLLTFVYPSREEVDRVYEKVKDSADSSPKDTEAYRIYHFFGTDPEGRKFEVQYFWDY